MTVEKFTRLCSRIPDSPGVYFFLGLRKEILYIGKATSLRNRIRSYFTDDIHEKRSPLIEKMVLEARNIEWTVTDSVLEALLLEGNLIRTHKPPYNTDAKDDKSFNHVIVTTDAFPRVLVVRAKDLGIRFRDEEIRAVYGPFTSGLLLKEAMRILRKIFPFYDTRTPVGKERSGMARGRIVFNRQIGLYPDNMERELYEKTIQYLMLFFEGKKRELIRRLERDMKTHARMYRFEEAAECKRRLFALTHIQDVALIKEERRMYRDDRSVRIEAYDIAHLQGAEMVGVMTVVEGGEVQKDQYRKFKIKTLSKAHDPAALAEVLDRRLGHSEWELPQCIVVDGGVPQKRRAESLLHKRGVHIPVVAVVKDEHHRPKRLLGLRHLITDHEADIIRANAEAHRFALSYHRTLRRARNLPATQ